MERMSPSRSGCTSSGSLLLVRANEIIN